MNSCFEKFVGFIRIMSDRLDRIAALKDRVLFLILSKLLKVNHFFLISSNYGNTGLTSNLSKNSTENILRLILEEVIMSNRRMPDRQLY